MPPESSTATANADRPSDQSTAKSDRAAEKILCPHCKRTATNGIKCLGMCVADSDY